MRKHGGTPSRRDKHVTPAAISPPGVAQGRFVGGQQSGLAGCKPPPLFTRGAFSCSSQGRRQGEPWDASPGPSAPIYLPTFPCLLPCVLGPLLPLLLDPVKQRRGGGVGCCGGGGLDDDMYTSLAVMGVCVPAAAVSPNVVCVCVAVCWFFSIPLV